MLAFDYRSYGLSTGHPSEGGLVQGAIIKWPYHIYIHMFINIHTVVILNRQLALHEARNSLPDGFFEGQKDCTEQRFPALRVSSYKTEKTGPFSHIVCTVIRLMIG